MAQSILLKSTILKMKLNNIDIYVVAAGMRPNRELIQELGNKILIMLLVTQMKLEMSFRNSEYILYCKRIIKRKSNAGYNLALY